MKKRKIFITFLTMILLFSVISPTITTAAKVIDHKGTYYIKNKKEKLYKKADSKATVVSTLKKNTKIKAYKKVKKKTGWWYKVKVGKKRGWIQAKNVIPYKIKSYKRTYYIKNKQSYLLKKPITKAKVVHSVKKNQKVVAYQKTKYKGITWYKVKIGKKRGWIQAKHVLPYKIKNYKKTFYIKNKRSNLLKKPTKNAKVAHSVKKNQKVVAYQKTKYKGVTWYKVKRGKKKGWIRAKDVSTYRVQKGKLVDLREIDPTIVIDLKYATKNNFTKKKIYTAAVPLLREETAKKLAKVNKEVKKKGYRIKVWDAYRPFSAQRKLWNAVSDKRYVAPPNRGSNHNRGASVDVTLVDRNGKEIKMPTGYDNFTKKAHRDYKKMNKTARKNMNYLTKVMKKHGFTTINTEWWHFTDKNVKKYPILNYPLKDFR